MRKYIVTNKMERKVLMNNLFEEDLINSINNIPNIEKIKNKK